MKNKLIVFLSVPLITLSAYAEDPAFGYAWGQPLPPECHWKWVGSVATYPEGCFRPWFGNFLTFWKWFSEPKESDKRY